MKKSYITGRNHDFYSRGKAMFDRIQPIPQTIPQIPQEHSSNRQWVGLTEREQGAIMEDLNAHGTNLYPFAQAIEAKLKEKNT